jgi:hypothetical protein
MEMETAALALPPSSDLPEAPPKGMSVQGTWDIVKNQFAKLTEYQRRDLTDASVATRTGGMLVDTLVGGTTAIAVPLVLEAFPRFKRIGRGSFYIDTQALLAIAALFAGGALSIMGWASGRAILEAGKGMGYSYLGIYGTRLGTNWFPPKTAAATM